MSNLIITLIALTLFVLFMGAGTNYISLDSIFIYSDKNTFSSALVNYHSGINTYKIANNTLPSTIDDFIPGIIPNPELPKYVAFSSYASNSSTGMAELCFDVEIENHSYFEMFDRISEKEGYQNLIVSNNCGDTTHVEPSSYPAAVVVTYYIR